MVDADYFKVERNTIDTTEFMTKLVAEHAGIDLDEIVVNTDLPGVITYIVKRGDTIESIATKFGTTEDTINSVNKLSSNSFLSVGEKLIISDTPGLLYTMKEKSSLIVFANQYQLNLEQLKTMNSFTDDNQLLFEGDEIFLPITQDQAAAKGLIDKPIYRPPTPIVQVTKPRPTTTTSPTKTTTRPTTTTTTVRTTSNTMVSTSSSDNGSIIASWSYSSDINNGFARGQCTWYAAIKRPDIFTFTDDNKTRQNRPFKGDAGEWLGNAAAAGLATGKTPKAGAIIVYARGGDMSAYGHVGIVVSVDRTNRQMVIEDMNYLKRYVVTQRLTSVDDNRVSGYIY